MIILVLSDLHLGRGRFLKNGQPNIMEDFYEDERFVEFLRFYSSDEYHWTPVHLVLNGDILNLLQIDIEGVFDHIIDDKLTVQCLDVIHKGHKEFFSALSDFLKAPNKKCTYIIGNHDAGMAFPLAQDKFCQMVEGQVDFSFHLEVSGVHIEHGHRYEAINTVAPTQYFLDGPNGSTILNLPWGGLFCVQVLPILRKDRPNLDKVRPMSSYIKWCLIHDFFFFLRLAYTVITFFIKSCFETYSKQNRNIKNTFNMVKQVTIYPKYGNMAKRIFRRNPNLHTVIMGHTHLLEWRRFPEGRYYFNTGTWNSLPSVDAGLHESSTKLSYIIVEISPKSNQVISTTLNEWQGHWRPYRADVGTLY